jgi:hypothetical protein
MATPRSLDGRLYRAALLLYPAAFRREFSQEMLADFEAARAEAVAVRSPFALWQFRGQMLRDAAATLGSQWVRSGWPAVLLLAPAGPIVLTAGLAGLWPDQLLPLPEGGDDVEMFAAVMLIVFVLVLIAAIILATSWSAHFVRHRRRRM